MPEPRTYRFHPLERRGLLLGLQAGQLATVAVGILLALAVLRAAPGSSGFLGAVCIASGTAVLACWPIAGRTCVSWAPVGIDWVVTRRGRVVCWRSDSGTGPPGVEILEAPSVAGDDPIGVVRDRHRGTWSAVLPVRSRPFTLLDVEEKERRLGSWGALLAAAARAGSPIHRLQWIERTTGGDGDALSAYLDTAYPSTAGRRSVERADVARDEVLRSYREVIAQAGPASQGHEALVVVTVDPRRAGRALRSFDGGRAGAVCALLRRELRLLQGQLRSADLGPGRPLDVADLARSVRIGSEPEAHGRRSTIRARSAWPMAVDERWSSVRLDGRWHSSYWISEWPRLDVGPDFMTPLLLVGGVRAVSVTMAPVSPARARREVESARTADLADEELRRRAGFLSTARHRREAEGALRREAELADGHGEYRFSGYVSVSAGTPDELDGVCAAVEQAAQQSHLELRRLYGQQREAFTWTLPLGRGVA